MANITQVNDQTFQSEVLSASGPVLVDFYADWCGPCKRMAPIVDAVADELASKCKFCKLNIDDAPQSASAYAVQSIPTLILFENGKPMRSMLGLQPKQAVLDLIG